jgi:MFS transporter, DHA1 family, tetracycline resistance protein
MMPLIVSTTGSPALVGTVMGAYGLSGLTAPLWGGLADRFHMFRWMMIGGSGAAALGLLLFALSHTPSIWILLALAINASAACTATVANLLVVEFHPQEEWDRRLSWLQTFFTGGQVLGLLFAAALTSVGDYRWGLTLAAASYALGGFVGWLTFSARTPRVTAGPRPVLATPVVHPEHVMSSPHHVFHFPTLNTLRSLKPLVASRFGLWMLVGTTASVGASCFFALYPVLMRDLYSIDATLSSLAYAVAAALSMRFYPPAGKLSHKIGPVRAIRLGYVIRVGAFLALFELGLAHRGGPHWFALPLFTVVVASYPPIGVGSATLTPQLSPIAAGEGIGLFNATTAIAAAIGAHLGGWLAEHVGFSRVPLVAMVFFGLAALLTYTLRTSGQPTLNPGQM